MKLVSAKKLRDIDALTAQLAQFNENGARAIANFDEAQASLAAAAERIEQLEARVAALEAKSR